MKVTYTLYNHSRLSNVIGFIAQLIVIPVGVIIGGYGIVYIKSEPWGIAIGLLMIGFGLFLMDRAEKLNKKASFNKWIKQLEQTGKLSNLASDVGLCLALYKANPDKITLQYIEKHNPGAAEIIRNSRP